MPKKPYAYAQLEGVAQEMRADKNLCFYWEYGDPVATLPTGEIINIAKEFGIPRTSGRGWAIDESWIAGVAIGLAASGMPCICRFPAMAQIYAMEFIYNQAGKLRHMTGGQANMPLVMWVDGGSRTRGSAGQHTEVGYESLYCHLPGLKVVVPSNAYDAKGLLCAAIHDPDPVVYYDYPEVKSGIQPDVPDDAYRVPIGKAAVRQEGSDLTLVAWAPATVDVNQALPKLKEAGLSVEFVDPRTLKPLDLDTLLASVKKTGRLLVVDHANWTNGFGSHVIAEVVQALPGVKARRISFPDAPGPGAGNMMAWVRPDAPKIVDAAKQIMKI
jgi:acetoin:2,6-dichlorophenolindophenol oxidoreductase subunit beta